MDDVRSSLPELPALSPAAREAPKISLRRRFLEGRASRYAGSTSLDLQNIRAAFKKGNPKTPETKPKQASTEKGEADADRHGGPSAEKVPGRSEPSVPSVAARETQGSGTGIQDPLELREEIQPTSASLREASEHLPEQLVPKEADGKSSGAHSSLLTESPAVNRAAAGPRSTPSKVKATEAVRSASRGRTAAQAAQAAVTRLGPSTLPSPGSCPRVQATDPYQEHAVQAGALLLTSPATSEQQTTPPSHITTDSASAASASGSGSNSQHQFPGSHGSANNSPAVLPQLTAGSKTEHQPRQQVHSPGYSSQRRSSPRPASPGADISKPHEPAAEPVAACGAGAEQDPPLADSAPALPRWQTKHASVAQELGTESFVPEDRTALAARGTDAHILKLPGERGMPVTAFQEASVVLSLSIEAGGSAVGESNTDKEATLTRGSPIQHPSRTPAPRVAPEPSETAGISAPSAPSAPKAPMARVASMAPSATSTAPAPTDPLAPTLSLVDYRSHAVGFLDLVVDLAPTLSQFTFTAPDILNAGDLSTDTLTSTVKGASSTLLGHFRHPLGVKGERGSGKSVTPPPTLGKVGMKKLYFETQTKCGSLGRGRWVSFVEAPLRRPLALRQQCLAGTVRRGVGYRT